jgi:hypothetical protein
VKEAWCFYPLRRLTVRHYPTEGSADKFDHGARPLTLRAPSPTRRLGFETYQVSHGHRLIRDFLYSGDAQRIFTPPLDPRNPTRLPLLRAVTALYPIPLLSKITFRADLDLQMQLQDFSLIRLLGDGTSGTVHLVREKSSGLLYALKSMPRCDGQGVEHGVEERNALLLLRGEHRIVQFYASFHDDKTFYIATVGIS